MVAEEYDLERPTKSYPKRKLLPQFDDEAPEPIPPTRDAVDRPDRPPRGRDRAANKAEHQPHHLAIEAEKQQVGDTHMTYDKTWKIE